jgi:hypothetical protein
LNSTNLASGISAFRGNSHWRRDFHNHQPAGLGGNSVGGYVTSQGVMSWNSGLHSGGSLWDDMLHELTFWKALRPFPTARFAVMPSALQNAFSALTPGLTGRQFPHALPTSHPLRTLFDSAQILKPTAKHSAVFPSKGCHMLAPWEFPIWDNEFAGNTSRSRGRMIEALDDWIELPSSERKSIGSRLTKPDYWCYREVLLLAWDTAPAALKSQLQGQLNRAIGSRVWAHYPYRTKIPELCLA